MAELACHLSTLARLKMLIYVICNIKMKGTINP